MARAFVAGALLLHSLGSDGAPEPTPLEATQEVEVVPPEADAPPEPAYSVWDDLARCESGERWHIATGNGYFGGLQMDMTFWRRHGGLQYAARPDLASRAAQIAVAEAGLAVQGFGAWPVCSRRIGAR